MVAGDLSTQRFNRDEYLSTYNGRQHIIIWL